MYDKGNSIHNNGAKLASGVRSANGLKTEMAKKIYDNRHPKEPKTASTAPKPLTK
jgi:hypothetical protein